METTAQYLIYLHAFSGGLALLCGLLAVLFKKGNPNHKRAGKVFYISLLSSAIAAIAVTLFPSKNNPFLLSIGVFSLYLLLSGFRALRYKNPTVNLHIDQLISGSMLITGLLMIFLPLATNGSLNIILTVFGSIGAISAIRDFLLYQSPERLKKHWMQLHLGNMMGAFIASVTAFVVVNQLLPTYVGWLGPSVIGTFYIIYWNRKLRGKGKKKKQRV